MHIPANLTYLNKWNEIKLIKLKKIYCVLYNFLNFYDMGYIYFWSTIFKHRKIKSRGALQSMNMN